MLRKRYWVAALALTLGACASAPQNDYAAFSAPAEEAMTVAVQNNYWQDMAIYVVKAGGARWRIGTVLPGTSATLRVPGDLTVGSDLMLYADPIGPDNGMTFPLTTVTPGSRVELTLENNLKFSSFWVR